VCMIDGADPLKLHHSGAVRARIQHRCDECGRTIEPGELYDRAAGLGWEQAAHWWTWKTCWHCCAAREWLRIVCEGWLYESVREDLEEHWEESWEYRTVWLGRAILGMRRQWRRRDGGLLPVLPMPSARVVNPEPRAA
jgi:hypothetical protein